MGGHMGSRATTPPLAGVRVVSVEQYGAGPWATLQLADLGAEVIKIEDPTAGGDVGRYVPPFQEGEDSLFFETFNRGTQSLSLDLRSDAGREVFHDLVRNADVVFSNLRGDLAAKLGLDYAALGEINPKIVCCALSGFGANGPRANQPGYDYLVQGLAGWMSLTGATDGPPTKSGLSLVDLSTGYVAVIALLAGLHRAQRDGQGCDCDISLFDVALQQLCYIGTWTATGAYVPERLDNSAHPSLVPFQCFAAADGWMIVACAKEHFWVSLCHAIERSDLLVDMRFLDFAARLAHREELVAILSGEFTRNTVAGWIETLQAAGVPCSEVNDVAQALEEPQAIARDAIVEVDHPRFGKVRQIASAVRVDGASREYVRAPQRDEHRHEILHRVCGYEPREIEILAREGAFGPGVAEA